MLFNAMGATALALTDLGRGEFVFGSCSYLPDIRVLPLHTFRWRQSALAGAVATTSLLGATAATTTGSGLAGRARGDRGRGRGRSRS